MRFLQIQSNLSIKYKHVCVTISSNLVMNRRTFGDFKDRLIWYLCDQTPSSWFSWCVTCWVKGLRALVPGWATDWAAGKDQRFGGWVLRSCLMGLWERVGIVAGYCQYVALCLKPVRCRCPLAFSRASKFLRLQSYCICTVFSTNEE